MNACCEIRIGAAHWPVGVALNMFRESLCLFFQEAGLVATC